MPSFCTSGFPEYPATLPPLPPLCRLLPPFVHPPPDRPGRVVGDIQRSVRPHRHAHRPVLRPRGVLLPKPVRERLVAAHRLAVLERHERYPVARLRQRRAVPGAVKRDECAAAIALGELRPHVERQAVRGPVARERDRRLLLLRTPPDLLAVAPVLRCQ